MPTFEMVCAAHGPYESTKKRCKHGCPDEWQKQEIRTAPAFRRSGNMRFIDQQLKGIAEDAGLTDLRNDPKANESVLQKAMRMKQLKAPDTMPHWGAVPHAKPGFSQNPGAEIPRVAGSNFGTVTGRDILGEIPRAPVGPQAFPAPRPLYVAKPKD